MIAVQLATSELVIILIGGLVAIYFASDPYKRRLVRAYRRHRKNLDSRSHIAFYADMLDKWDLERRESWRRS